VDGRLKGPIAVAQQDGNPTVIIKAEVGYPQIELSVAIEIATAIETGEVPAR